MRPPSVVGWQGGIEWINTGAYVERINFAGRMLNDPDKIGVRDIIDRIKDVDSNSDYITSDELVDRCLDVLGPFDVMGSTRSGIKKYALKYGELSWDDEGSCSKFDSAAVAIIQLVVSTQEYQTV